jgi:lipopolysaccharide transport system ATP-binding protein
MRPVVIVDQVAKKYSRRSTEHLQYGLGDLARELIGGRKKPTLREDEFWAVDNVTFALEAGEALAVIGRNGSGKTTLLKLICGLMKLDAGTVVCDGRVQTLINLGAGFDMELSGLDNIYNSASLMGLSRREIESAAKEAIEFSELGSFIRSPVGTYSTGMQARLGFSVAVSLKPDILVVDEILAVGDQAFQNKCSIRLHQVKRDGVGIILVTHSLPPVVQLCDRALWLDSGRKMALGPAKPTLRSYLAFLERRERERIRAKEQKPDRTPTATPRQWAWVDDVRVSLNVGGAERDAVTIHDEVAVVCRYHLAKPASNLTTSLTLCRQDNLALASIAFGSALMDQAGGFSGTARIPDLNVVPGRYSFRLVVRDSSETLYNEVAKEFVVEGDGRLHWHLADFEHEYRIYPD